MGFFYKKNCQVFCKKLLHGVAYYDIIERAL